MSKTKNVKDLRGDLVDLYDKLKSGDISLEEAKVHANVAGKIISSAKLQLAYDSHMEEKRTIEFLEVG